jgi:nicotinamidase-related amidase
MQEMTFEQATQIKLGYPDFDFDLDPATTALLIVDMQRFCADLDYGVGEHIGGRATEAGRYYFDRLADTVIPNNQALLALFRAHNMPVVFLTIGPESLECAESTPLMAWKWGERRKLSPRGSTFIKGTDAHDIIDELRPLADEIVLNKTTGGAFNSTALHQILRNMGIQHVVITGVATNACVESTARGAADLGFWSILVDDACATFDPAMHESTLQNFRTIFGKVKTTREVLDDLAERLGAPSPAVAAAASDPGQDQIDRAVVAQQADNNRLAFPKIDFEFDPEKTVLLIVDMQRFCASPDYGVGAYLGTDNPLGQYYFDRLYSTVIPNNQRLLAFARENGIKVAFLTIGPETLAGHELSPLHRAEWVRRRALSPVGETFVRGTPENGVIDELRPLPDEPVVNKITAGGFVSTPLDVYLRGMGAEYLLVTGVATNACVESTARDASDRGYWTYLVDDACGAFDPGSHAATLRNFAAMSGRVGTTQTAIEELTAKIEAVKRLEAIPAMAGGAPSA